MDTGMAMNFLLGDAEEAVANLKRVVEHGRRIVTDAGFDPFDGTNADQSIRSLIHAASRAVDGMRFPMRLVKVSMDKVSDA